MASIELTFAAASKALAGGALIGLAAAVLIAGNGRIAGISGIFGQLWTSLSSADRRWRIAFLAGLVGGGFALSLVAPSAFGAAHGGTAQLVLSGVLVGLGTQLANGCTSGHGICGLGRGSLRSLVATLTFMAAGMLVVAMIRARIGGT